MSLPRTTDYLVIGGGVIGLNLALEIRRRQPTARVTVIDKEVTFGVHASGRNSGVLHAGFYYTADSLKARFTRDGNAAMVRYCQERGLPLNRCGKLVVARSEADHPALDELLRRARLNGVELHQVTAGEAVHIEPRARTVDRALWSPTTASVDPRAVMQSLVRDARATGVTLCPDTAFRAATTQRIRTSQGDISAAYIINAAGLQADAIAHAFGFGERYRILPFKGIYLYGAADQSLRTNIYPVPQLHRPFLGVHFTVDVAGRVKLGPTAIPALWREQYGILQNFNVKELTAVVGQHLLLLLRNDCGFRTLAREELPRYLKRRMAALASELATGVSAASFRHRAASGIRAQLLDIRDRRLEMDFVYEGDDRSFHVLNSVSPAFTCAIPFASFLLDQVVRLSHR